MNVERVKVKITLNEIRRTINDERGTKITLNEERGTRNED